MESSPKPHVVLVHGAFADGSSWQRVIPAKRMGATTSEIDSSHVPFISHPDVVVRVIEAADRAKV